MNKKIRRFCIVSCLIIISNSLCATHVISLFLRPYPTLTSPIQATKKSEKLKQPGRIAYYNIKNLVKNSLVAGIFAAYRGFITVSTKDGQILFPNRQPRTTINLLLTTRLTPIIMVGTTIHHWEQEEGTPAALYKLECKQDEETEKFYWEVQSTSLPDNKIIPVSTIWIVARPEKAYVPTGIIITTKGQNFILPDIYVKSGIMKIQNALYMLYLKHFFSQVKKEYKTERTYSLEQII